MTPVRLEPPASLSRVKHSTTEPLRSLVTALSLSKNINPSLVLVQPRKTGPFITERLLMGRKESNQTNKQITITASPLDNGSIQIKVYNG